MADKSSLHNKSSSSTWTTSIGGGGSSADLSAAASGSISPSSFTTPTVTFHFQSGLSREQVQVPIEKLTLKTLKDLASSFVNRKLNPDHGVPSLYERLMLFKHDYSSTNILRFINAASDIVDGTLIEVVVSSNYVPSGDVEFRPHTMEVHSYRSPTFCDYCGEMLFGLTHQGLKCKGCNQNYHKRCAYKVPNNCAETATGQPQNQRKYSTATAMGASLTPSGGGSQHQQRRRSFNASPTGSMKKNSTGGFDYDASSINSSASMALLRPSSMTPTMTGTAGTSSSSSMDLSHLAANLPQYHHQVSAPSPLMGDSVFLSISGADSGTDSMQSMHQVGHENSLLMVRGGGGAGGGGSSAPGSPRDKRSHSIGGRPLKIDQIMQARIKVPHTFLVHSYVRPTMCQLCKKLLKGLYKQGLQCKDCKFNCHKKCAPLVPADCTGEPPANVSTPATPPGGLPGTPMSTGNGRGGSSASTGGGSTSDVENESSPTSHQVGGSGDDTSLNGDPSLGGPGGINIPRVLIDRQPSNETIAAAAAAAQQSSQQIPVQRLVQSIRQSKRRTSGILKEGWVVHFTDRDAMRKRHFWRLDTKTITLYQSNTSPKYYKEIQLGEILAVETAPQPLNNNNSAVVRAGAAAAPRFAFTMKVQPAGTAGGTSASGGGERDAIIYYIGGESVVGITEGSATTPAGPAAGGPAAAAAATQAVTDREWENAIRRALMPPVSPKSSTTAGTATVPQAAVGGAGQKTAGSAQKPTTPMLTVNHGAAKPGGDAGSSSSGRSPPAVPTILAGITSESDISKIYQIFTDEVLGSGQFGVVYGGVFRQNGVKVAVKVIEKLRFPNKQEEQLKTEVGILQKLDHPGVVRLHSMFETPERIFVVMEKMAGDMLEMILSSERSRLNERITRFLIYQILSALRYLHTRDIVHCDLKPENVLLTSNADFPQTKLCDFGFARIIGEKSFRRSVVGTPAYLAPEVLRNKRYNRALDCWSVGVIVYVSLSGTFPFNEDEDISDQIQDAHFMFPPNPWQEITKPAIDVITRLLVVKIRERLTVAKALQHEWLQDYQLYVDLRRLEADFGWRFLTHESDDARWELYRQKHNFGPQPAPPQKDYFMEKYYREADDYDENDNKQIKEE